MFYGPLNFVRYYPSDTVPKRYNQEGKTNLDLLEQEIVSVPYADLHLTPDRQPRQNPTTQFFTGRMPILPPNQQRQSTEGTILILKNRNTKMMLSI